MLHPFSRRLDEAVVFLDVDGRELLARMTKGGSASALEETCEEEAAADAAFDTAADILMKIADVEGKESMVIRSKRKSFRDLPFLRIFLSVFKISAPPPLSIEIESTPIPDSTQFHLAFFIISTQGSLNSLRETKTLIHSCTGHYVTCKGEQAIKELQRPIVRLAPNRREKKQRRCLAAVSFRRLCASEAALVPDEATFQRTFGE